MGENTKKLVDIKENQLLKIDKELLEILLQDKVDYEFRTTVVKEYHEVEDIKKILKTAFKKE